MLKPQSAKTTARLGAVMATYASRFDVDANTSQEYILDTIFAEEGVWAPNKNYMRHRLGLYEEHHPQAHALLEKHLPAKWNVSRLEQMLYVILLHAIVEIAFEKTPLGVVFDEYLEIVAAYYGDREVSFAHGVLQDIARDVREGLQKNEPGMQN